MVKTNCYKCETELEVPSAEVVHPLCLDCEGEFETWFADQLGAFKKEVCPDCESEITNSNPLIEEYYNPEQHGGCVDCYDPTPAGEGYSPGFEMNH